MNLSSRELEELADDINDDDAEEAIREYRERMMKEMRKEEKAGRFGSVIPIGRDDYTREVTEASKVDEPMDEAEEDEEDMEDEDDPSGEGRRSAKGRGTGVVCFLYKDGYVCSDSHLRGRHTRLSFVFVCFLQQLNIICSIPRSDRTYVHVRALAAKHPRTKFVSIVGDRCLPNLPDSRVPMFIVYRGGEIRTQIVSWAADKERKAEGEGISLEHRVWLICGVLELEALLILCGAIVPSPRLFPGKSHGVDDGPQKATHSDEEESEDEDDHGARRSKSTFTNHTMKNIRGPARTADDSDSDFDL